MDINIEEFSEHIRVVDQKRNYWFIRTFGGELYNDFLEKNYVGFGFNNVPLAYIKEADKSEFGYKRLKEFIENNSDYKKGEATKWTNQLIGFERQVNIDDIVIIPSKNSEQLSFGIVESPTYLVENPGTFQFNNKYESYPEKRRNIKWIKTVDREELGSEMTGLISSHQGLTNANWYNQYIEGNLSSIYIKDDRVFLSIRINQDEEINAFHLSRFLDSLTYFYKEFCDEFKEEADEELYIKIKLQSKGKMLLNGACKVAGLGLLAMLVMSKNSDFEADFLVFKLKASTGEGFFSGVNDILNQNLERKIKYEQFLDSTEKLKVKTVEEDKAVVTDVGEILNDYSNRDLEVKEDLTLKESNKSNLKLGKNIRKNVKKSKKENEGEN